ncbi:hypothetical protein [Pendulispora albinea]|uniref:Uncharacterized protein n=1 Tax=Pendulispora albinea TaxID=2741071 RepID=A0ABZ2LQX0_9BACT
MILAAFVAMTFARTAGAEPRELSVNLDERITGCPDAWTIRQRLLSALPRGPRDEASDATDARVDFARQGRGYEVTITLTGLVMGTRIIRHPKTSCGAMIDAAGVTLALMLDPLEAAKKNDERDLAPPAAPEKPPEERGESPKATVPARAAAPSLVLDLGGGITRGLMGRIAPVFGISARWTHPAPWSFGLGVFHQPLQRSSVLARRNEKESADGNVSLALTGFHADACFTPFGDHAAMALDVCATMRFAMASGTARGYPREGTESRPLITGGPALLWSQQLGWLRSASGEPVVGWSLWARGSVDVPLVRASYTVDGVGLVYNGESPFVALTLGASLAFP